MRSTRTLLALLALTNLVIGSSAFVIGGIVAPIAAELAVTPAAVGQSMTAYALATALFAPLLVVATGGWPRKRALLAALALFTVGNAVCTLAPSLPVLLAGRVAMGMGSMFTPLAAGLALALVEPARRGQALSFVFLGVSLAYVVGMPLGTWVGLTWSWRAAIGLMTVACALMGLLLVALLPADVKAPGASLAGIGAALRQQAVWSVLATTMTYFVAIFAVVTYLGPVLQALAGLSPKELSATLSLFGLAGMAGTLLGGRNADLLSPRRAVLVTLPLLATAMLLLPLTRGHPGWMLAVLMLWGCTGFSLMAPQQMRLAAAAPAQTPLLLSLNTSMLYIGTALGAAVGGLAIAPLGFERLGWVAAPFALLAWLLTWVTARPVRTSSAVAAAGRSGS